jgi:alpha-beta hydrolase superfamily lysophospholipase
VTTVDEAIRHDDLPDGVAVNEPMPETMFLAAQPDPVLAFLHQPSESPSRGTAVMICPPFGWEEMCSYRARRRWSQALARAGFPAARFDFPGTGDSGGNPTDPDRVTAWTAAVNSTAEWLRERTGCERVAAIGIGFGGIIACRAVADGAAIDDLILWAVPASGRLLVREMRTYAGVVAARHPADGRGGPPLPEGDSELIGFLLSAETRSELEAIKLTELDVPRATERRILMLGRDGLNADKRLRAHFEQAGADVTVADTDDYAMLMAHPQEAQTPTATIERTIGWLTDRSAPAGGGLPSPGKLERPAVEMDAHGATIRETPITLTLSGGQTFGVLTEPVSGERAPLTGVVLNAGALRHIGPNRTSVEMARRWAAKGVPTVRLDLSGIGDADGDERGLVSNAALYAHRSTADTLAVLDQLTALGLSDRFVLGGLCSGAYWSLHAALADPRVAGALLLNLYSFYWSEALVAERATFETLGALRDQGWRRIVRRDVRADQVVTAMKSFRPARIRRGARHPVERSQRDEIERALDQLRDQGTQVLLLLSYGEPLYDQLVRSGQIDALQRWPNLALDRIPSRDHMFRALWLQERMHESVDRGLDRVLESAAETAPPPR